MAHTHLNPLLLFLFLDHILPRARETERETL